MQKSHFNGSISGSIQLNDAYIVVAVPVKMSFDRDSFCFDREVERNMDKKYECECLFSRSIQALPYHNQPSHTATCIW